MFQTGHKRLHEDRISAHKITWSDVTAFNPLQSLYTISILMTNVTACQCSTTA